MMLVYFLFAIGCLAGMSLVAQALRRDAESLREFPKIQNAPILGGSLSAFLLVSSPIWSTQDGWLFPALVALGVSIIMALRFADLLEKRIAWLAGSSFSREVIACLVGFLFSFFPLYLTCLAVNYSLGSLDAGLTNEVGALLHHAVLLPLGISLSLNLVGFLIAYRFSTDKLTDLSYGMTFVGITSLLYLMYDNPLGVSFGLGILLLIFLWAIRLSVFLFVRIMKWGRDKRFDGMREDWSRLGAFWLLQGLSVPFILLPVSFFFTLVAKETTLPMLAQKVGYGGMGLAGLGLVIEHVADWQKYRFRQEESHGDKWMEKGLWYYSRHPNYFGEMVFWIGVYMALFPYLSCLQKTIGILGPLYIIGLLSFVSGIPIAEGLADERWGEDVAYQAYKRRTSVLIPWITRRERER